jgi:hypothetical protein
MNSDNPKLASETLKKKFDSINWAKYFLLNYYFFLFLNFRAESSNASTAAKL